MLTWLVVGAGLLLLVLLALAVRRLRKDETAVRRLKRGEYDSLVKYIWHQ